MEPDNIEGPEVSYEDEDDYGDDYEDTDKDDAWRDDPRAVAQRQKLPELTRRLATVTPEQWHTITRRRSNAFPSDLDVSISVREWANDPRNNALDIEDELLAAEHATYAARDGIVGSSDRFTASAALGRAVLAIAQAHHSPRWQTEQLLAPFEELGIQLRDLIPHDAPTTPPRPRAPYVDPTTQYGPRTPQIRTILERLGNLTDQQWRAIGTRLGQLDSGNDPLYNAARKTGIVLRDIDQHERAQVNKTRGGDLFHHLEDNRHIFDSTDQLLDAHGALGDAISYIALADRNPAWITHAILQPLTDNGIPIDDLIPDNAPTEPAPPATL